MAGAPQFDFDYVITGSGFGGSVAALRLIATPQVRGRNMVVRLTKIAAYTLRHPARSSRVIFVDDWAKRTQALTLMQALDSRLRLARGRLGLMTRAEAGESPTGFLPQAANLGANPALTILALTEHAMARGIRAMA